MKVRDPFSSSQVHRSLIGIFLALTLSFVAQIETNAEAGELPRATPEEASLSQINLDAATALLQQAVDDGQIAGAIAAIVRDGKIVYFEEVGYQDAAAKIPMQSETIFRIRSMSKPITGAAVMALVDRGKIGLQDPVSKYLPEFGNAIVFDDAKVTDVAATHPPVRPITIEDLLLHTSGLNHQFSKLYKAAKVRSRAEPLSTLTQKVASVPLMTDPGTRWQYSIATTVLGRVVEVASGQDFDDFLESEIFEPLGMTQTGFYVPAENADLLATAYAFDKDRNELSVVPPDDGIPFTEKPALFEGAAGLSSTTMDFLRFAQMILNKGDLDGQRVLAPETVEQMTRNHLPEELLPISFPNLTLDGHGWG